jgi:hypothetical protein
VRLQYQVLPLLLIVSGLAACGTPESSNGTSNNATPTPAPISATPLTTIAENQTETRTAKTALPPSAPMSTSTGGFQVATVVAQVGVASPAITAGPAVKPTPLHAPAIITLQENKQTLQLTIGDTFELRLSDQHNWTVTIDDEGIVARAPDSQGMYKALARGQTQLVAIGDPACRQAKSPCKMPSLVFQLTIVIR